jgi:hypothetical protein
MTTVSVTAEHITKGFARDCERCPVALAIRDAFPAVAHVTVTGLYVRMGIREHEMPAEVQQFTWAFDTGQPIEPFTFELDYPAVTR